MQLVSNTPHTPLINYARRVFVAVLGGIKGGRGRLQALIEVSKLCEKLSIESRVRVNRFRFSASSRSDVGAIEWEVEEIYDGE